jgi:hypothetical protein
MIGIIQGVNDPSFLVRKKKHYVALSGPGRPRWLVVATGTVFRIWPDPNDRHSVPRRTYWPVRPRSGQCRKATEHRRTMHGTCTHYLSHAVASSMFNRSTPTKTQAIYYFPERTGISHTSSFSQPGGFTDDVSRTAGGQKSLALEYQST